MTGINLFIGVGGSGSATLRYLYHDLKGRLIANGWPWDERAARGQGMPKCWRFVEIDVDSTGNPSDVPDVPAGAFKRIVLASEPDQMSTIYNILRSRHLRPELNGWLPQLNEMAPFNPYEGAGQYRAIGRSVFLARGRDALDAIKGEASVATGNEAERDLTELATRCGLATDSSERRVVLVSSLSGGSGSGMWLDIAQWLNGRPAVQTESWMSQQLYTFLYLPEVHELIDGPAGGLMPNSMLSTAEMLSAFADRSPYSDVSESWLTALGIGPHTYSTKAPRNLFMVGRAGTGGVTYNTVGQVYDVTSRTIGALSFSYGKGFSRVTVNEQTPPPLVPLLKVADHVTSSNIGYSRLDLGREALTEYSVRRLFSETMNRLMEGHRSARLVETESDDDTIRRVAGLEEENFFVACGLHERDSDIGANDQILDAIMSKDDLNALRDRFAGALGETVREVTAAVKDRRKQRQQMEAEFPSLRDRYLSMCRLKMLTNAVDYADRVRVMLLTAVAESVAEYSVPVTLALLQRLNLQLETAHGQLTQAMTADPGRVTVVLEEFYANFKDKLDRGAASAKRSMQAERRRATAAFIREVQTNLIRPVVKVLEGWTARTRADLLHSENKHVVFDWNRVDVPKDLRPSPNTVMLLDVDKFDESFRSLLEMTFSVNGEPTNHRQALRSAVVEIASYQWPEVTHSSRDAADTRSGGQLFLRQTGTFGLAPLREKLAAITAESEPAQIAAVFEWFTATDARSEVASFSVSGWPEILATTRTWCTSREGAMSRYLREGFGKWLDSQHPDFALRSVEFAEQFERAVRSAAPLVQYDHDTFTNVVSADAMGERLIVEPDIPVSEGNQLAQELKQRVSEVHRGLGLDSGDFSIGGRDTSQIEIMRTFDQGMHPLAFSSLTRSIVDGFGAAGDRFWSFRRARPLSHALGLTPAQVLAIVRGWLVVRILNLLDTSNGKIWIRDRWHQIPRERLRGQHRFFGPDGNPDASAWLEIALESLPYRLVQYPYDRSSLDFYVMLASLGGYDDGTVTAKDQEGAMNASDGGVGSQATRSLPVRLESLQLWIDTGVLVPGAPVPKSEIAGTSAGTAKERLDAVTGYLERAEERVEGFVASALAPDGDPRPTLIAEEQLALHFSDAVAQLRASLSGKPAQQPNDRTEGL